MEEDSGFVLAEPLPTRSPKRAAVTRDWLADETILVRRLIAEARMPTGARDAVLLQAADWVRRVRELRDRESPLDAFMRQYDLSSEEGVLLMCLAEALLRIPDSETAEKLIADKLGSAAWNRHLGTSDSLFVNASTWGLMLTGHLIKLSPDTETDFRGALKRLVGKSSEPVIRLALRQAMKLMGHQFVMGRTIGEALKNSRAGDQRAYRHSYDMLGEAALTADDADRYLAAYRAAITAIGKQRGQDPNSPVHERPGISVKLSALHPRYEVAQRARVLAELTPRLLQLARQARDANIGFTVDAEEADRLELSLDVIERVFEDQGLSGWEGFGLAVQAFQKRAPALVDWLAELAQREKRRIAVRLVKGAYWDTEVKRAQEAGLEGYPVYTRKLNTDVAYLACAKRLLAARHAFYPMFATHNAHTAAAVREMAQGQPGWEFQRLHGMGEALYAVIGEDTTIPCRVYAPVGSHEDLLPYLVRRLLENGANTSFVNRIFDDDVPVDQLAADPVDAVAALDPVPNPALPAPAELYGAERPNSQGLNLADDDQLRDLAARLNTHSPFKRARGDETPGFGQASPLSPALTKRMRAAPSPICDPADRRRVIGDVVTLDPDHVGPIVEAAAAAHAGWTRTPVAERAALLVDAANALERRRDEFLALLVREAGKTLPDAAAEVREATDFLRYYAAAARDLQGAPARLPGPTGEHNELQLHGRGAFACISPWNFPLAIFTGQVAAALVTGNTVVAKPAEQTPLVAHRMTRLLLDTGLPRDVLQLAPGAGDVGAALTSHPALAGVVFTGSFEVAKHIERALAARDGPIATLIAETGGQNAMIVDSSALPEQVVRDALRSVFGSAGQRCSALRVLYLQEEIADRVIGQLRGAMRELVLGDPGLLSTDVGPVIDREAWDRLEEHAAALEARGALLERLLVLPECQHGTFFPPCLAQIPGVEALDREHFGPILHVARFDGADLGGVVDRINATGYGLTLGVHSRIESTWREVQARARVGNVYINRGMTGAVVGVQPFGGEGRSGTGPKAGGPHYLVRFVTERTLTVNTAAVGGNAALLSQQ